MKKSTLFLLAGAAVLAVITILVTSKGTPPPPPKLSIDGYATKEQLAAQQARGIMESPVEIPSPIDEIVIERDPAAVKPGVDAQIHLVRDGEGKDATWRMTAPVEASAVKYEVEKISQLFESPTLSKYSRALKPADLARYDFEPARRVRVTLKSKGAVWNGVDLVVGRVEKGEGGAQGEPPSSDTWVMKADDPATAYLVGGKDLRTAVDADLGHLRDKKVFGFDGDDVTQIDIVSPDGQKVVLSGTRSETPAPPADPANPDAPPAKPTVKVDWKLTEPAGVVGDASISGYAKSLAGLRVNDFVALDRADAAATAALAGKVWTITATVKPKGKDPVATYTLKVADGGNDVVWAQLDGKKELLSLASYTAKSLRKSLDDLKNKVVYDLTPEDVTELTLKGDTGPITLVKNGATWTFTAPAVAYPGDPGVILKQLSKVTAVRWARADEQAAARAALATPDIDAVVKTKDGTARAVRFSKVLDGGDGDKNRWGVVGDVATAEPFQIQDYNAKRFETTVTAMRWKKLLTASKDQIQRVEITPVGAAAPTVLERMPTDSGGGELAVVSPPAGKQTKEEAARTLGSTLAALDAKSFQEGKLPAETGLDPALATKVVVKLADGSSTTLMISTKSSGEGEVFAVADTGPLANTVVGINEYQAKNLTKTMADMLEDAPAPAPAPGPAPGGPAPGGPAPEAPAPGPTPTPPPAPAPQPKTP